ncbi:MAG: hypothetical protein JWO69_2055 [Thermoleophilia bacterium]|nr:hypothetical protein [Thermoleophilia bacterium]
MKIAVVALALFALTACGGGEEAEPDLAAPAATTEAPAETTAAPKPKKSKNPLASSSNKTACAKSRREVSQEEEVFAGAGNGTELPEDVAKAAGRLQDELSKTASYAEGAIRVEMLGLSDAYGRMKVSISTGDNATLSQAVTAQNTGLGALNKLCASIGE